MTRRRIFSISSCKIHIDEEEYTKDGLEQGFGFPSEYIEIMGGED